MARNLTAAMQTELAKAGVQPILFFEGEFTSGMVRLWTGIGQITWNAVVWTGAGKLGTISPISESAEVQAEGIIVSLSGIPSDLITNVLSEARQGKPVKLWLGFMDSAGAVIADPVQSFSGRMDVPEIEEQGATATIRIRVENRLIDMNRPRERRYTHEDQQIDYPGDLGFEYVPSLQELSIVWGKAPSLPASSGGGCVSPDTLIETARGPITADQLKQDDILISSFGHCRIKRIGKLENQPLMRISNAGRELICSTSHKLLLDAEDISTLRVEKLEIAGPVYYIEAEEPHVYVANGFLSHNKMDLDPDRMGRIA